MKALRTDKGFTLVELMVVVLIVGILVAVAIPVINYARDYAKRNTCKANLRTLDGAVEQWVAADPSNDPGSLDDLGAAQAAISDRVTDWTSATTCPSGGAYTVSDGSFACPNAVALGHAYY